MSANRNLFTESTLQDYDRMIFREPGAAFDDAIAAGRLSADRQAPNFAGLYMYMGTVDGVDTFKHKDTRRYLAPAAAAVVSMLAPAASWAHDMHGLTHDHASGAWLLLAWAVAAAAVYAWDVWTDRAD